MLCLTYMADGISYNMNSHQKLISFIYLFGIILFFHKIRKSSMSLFLMVCELFKDCKVAKNHRWRTSSFRMQSNNSFIIFTVSYLLLYNPHWAVPVSTPILVISLISETLCIWISYYFCSRKITVLQKHNNIQKTYEIF